MRKYNENLLDATRKLSLETLDKSTRTVYKLTHPSDEVSKIGSTVGKGMGIGLIALGTIAAIGGSMWGSTNSCMRTISIIHEKFRHRVPGSIPINRNQN